MIVELQNTFLENIGEMCKKSYASPAPAPMGGASPFATGLSTAMGVAGLFGKLYG